LLRKYIEIELPLRKEKPERWKKWEVCLALR